MLVPGAIIYQFHSRSAARLTEQREVPAPAAKLMSLIWSSPYLSCPRLQVAVTRAYYFDNVPGDQRLVRDSGIPVDNVTLAKIGVLRWHIPVTAKYTEIDAVARRAQNSAIP